MDHAFVFQVYDVQDAEYITDLLQADFIYRDETDWIERDYYFSLVYWLDQHKNRAVMISVYGGSEADPTTRIYGALYPDFHAGDLPLAFRLAYEIFCGLERRGWQVDYLKGNIDWQE